MRSAACDFLAAARTVGAYQVSLPTINKMMRQLRMRAHQILERVDQSQMILARLKIAHRQNKRADDLGKAVRMLRWAASRATG